MRTATTATRTRAPFGRRLAPVTAHEDVGAYRVLKVRDETPAPGAPPRPGQFYMLAAALGWGGGGDERPFLARACSLLRIEATAGVGSTLHFLLEDVGPGTRCLCQLQAPEQLWLTGPLGTGFAAPGEGRRALLVGGGVGIAPLAGWQDELRARHVPHAVLLGFRDEAHSRAAALLSRARVATDDGSAGHHGLVTDLLVEELERDAHATVYACGPPPMLEAVREMCERRMVPAQLALESGMACGFGACYGCVVATRDGSYLRVCVDGPVVDAALLSSAWAPAHHG